MKLHGCVLQGVFAAALVANGINNIYIYMCVCVCIDRDIYSLCQQL